MIDFLIHTCVALHAICMTGLVIFGCHRLWLIACWGEAVAPPLPHPIPAHKVPVVTIQLPIYNESRVAGRVIDAAASIRWPLTRLDIQILDDSTDETKQIVDKHAALWVKKEVSIQVIRRLSRAGYKAGALANGLKYAGGEFIAIFDADFVPPKNFLEKTVPYFENPDIGMVQTRWGFLNSGFSWLTRIQALLLSPHFKVEHNVRCSRSLFFNFNGTAGVWRRIAIESAGGWKSDTVTEDLDLSYRAQLAGWRFLYLDSVVVPSELPATLSGFRGQQQRWTKGSIQTARKILPQIIKSRFSAPIKIEAVAHLLANLCWLFGFVTTITLFPLIIYRTGIGPYQILRIDVPVFIFSGGAFLFYYLCYSLSALHKRSVPLLLVLPAFCIGLAPSLTLAVLKGLLFDGGYFYRTPKFGLKEKASPEIALYKTFNHIPHELFINSILLLYTFAPILLSFHRETWSAIPFLFLFPLGFLLIIGKDLHEFFHLRKA